MGRKRGIQYRGGSFFRLDDRSGFVVRAENTEKEWTGLIVDKKLWEERQPQDFVKGTADLQTVPDPRSDPPAQFVGPVFTTLSAPALIGDTFLFLAATTTFSADDKIGVMLDTGVYFNVTQVGAAVPTGIHITPAIAGSRAASGNQVTNYGSTGP